MSKVILPVLIKAKGPDDYYMMDSTLTLYETKTIGRDGSKLVVLEFEGKVIYVPLEKLQRALSIF